MSLTVGDRLKQLSGLSGATVGAMLLAIGSGTTMAGCLVSYSGLASGTVAEHLRVDRLPDARYVGGGESAAERDRIIREHYEYLDQLREIKVQIADDMRGARTIALRSDMAVPDAILPPTMRGTVPPTRVADVIGNPLILAALALLIDEADD